MLHLRDVYVLVVLYIQITFSFSFILVQKYTVMGMKLLARLEQPLKWDTISSCGPMEITTDSNLFQKMRFLGTEFSKSR